MVAADPSHPRYTCLVELPDGLNNMLVLNHLLKLAINSGIAKGAWDQNLHGQTGLEDGLTFMCSQQPLPRILLRSSSSISSSRYRSGNVCSIHSLDIVGFGDDFQN